MIKLLEENIGKTFSDINHSSVSKKTIEIKAKINKWDLIKLVSFFIARKTISKTKRQPIDWKKIFANDTTNKSSISKIYIQLNNKQPSQNMGRRPK